MAERPWHAPDADPRGRAAVMAEDMARRLGIPVVVCAVIIDGEMAYNLLDEQGYALLREQQKHRQTAPVCKIFPDGRIHTYEVVEVTPITPEWCVETFYRVNPGARDTMPAGIPSLYLLDFARAVEGREGRRR